MICERKVALASGDLNLAVTEEAGAPLLLLHGVLRRWDDFAIVLPGLAAHWQVHGLDFRGHGRSDRTAGAYRVVDYVTDAAEVVESHLAAPVVLVGHSLGAMVAAAVAARGPDRVRALVLEDPPFQTMGSRLRSTVFASQFAGIQRLLGRASEVVELTQALADLELHSADGSQRWRLGDLRDRAALRYSAACLRQVDPLVLEPIVAGTWLQGYDLESIVASIRCPTLVLRGNLDRGAMLAPDDAAFLARRLPDSATIEFPDVGHLIHAQACDRYLQAVIPFLQSLT